MNQTIEPTTENEAKTVKYISVDFRLESTENESEASLKNRILHLMKNMQMTSDFSLDIYDEEHPESDDEGDDLGFTG